MKIFISWSGELSRKVAEILRKYIPCMHQGLKVFLSEHDIESGARWGLRLARELEESNFGIICLTSDNISSPWLLYEAGALTKHIEGMACCLLVGGLQLSDITGPLSQFQNKPFSEKNLRQILKDINKQRDEPLEAEQLDMIFSQWWPNLKSDYDSVLKSIDTKKESPAKRSQSEILEELVGRIRSIERIVSHNSASPNVIFESPVGTITKDTVFNLISRLAHRLTDSQKNVLKEISKCKLSRDEQRLEHVLNEASDNDMKLLTNYGFLIKHKEGIRMHKLLSLWVNRNEIE